jgi:transcriptional regulator with XRE-family HTH domain
MKLGEKLKQAREEAGLKQREVASMLNLDQAKIIRIEKGIIKVDAETILPKLAKLYKKPIGWFYEEIEEKDKLEKTYLIVYNLFNLEHFPTKHAETTRIFNYVITTKHLDLGLIKCKLSEGIWVTNIINIIDITSFT